MLKSIAIAVASRLIVLALTILALTLYAKNSQFFETAVLAPVEQSLASMKEISQALQ